jgi:hypothetical protein
MSQRGLMRAVVALFGTFLFAGTAAAQPAPDLLERVRLQRQFEDVRATALVMAGERSIAIVKLVSPSAARACAKLLAEMVDDDPDIGTACRERLRGRLERFLKN